MIFSSYKFLILPCWPPHVSFPCITSRFSATSCMLLPTLWNENNVQSARHSPRNTGNFECNHRTLGSAGLVLHDLPKAPPISAPLVGIFTLTIPQSDPNGLKDSNTKVLRNLPSLKLSSSSLSRLIYWFRFSGMLVNKMIQYCNIIFWREPKLVNKTNNQWKLVPLYCYCLVVSVFLDPKYATCIYHLSL